MKVIIKDIIKSSNAIDIVIETNNSRIVTMPLSYFTALFPYIPNCSIGTSFEYQVTYVQSSVSQTATSTGPANPAPVSSPYSDVHKAISSEVDRLQRSIASRHPGLEPAPVPACNCLQVNGHAAWCNVEGV